MACDDRLEIRIPRSEKIALMEFANSRGQSVSQILRFAANVHMKRPTPLAKSDASELAALRRRVNAMAAERTSPELEQAHARATALLRRRGC